jgi:hypothetical protein
LLSIILVHHATAVRHTMAAVKNCTGVGFCIYRVTAQFKCGRMRTNIPGTFSFIGINTSAQDCCNKYNLFISAQCYFLLKYWPRRDAFFIKMEEGTWICSDECITKSFCYVFWCRTLREEIKIHKSIRGQYVKMHHYHKSYPAARANLLVSGRQTRYFKLSSPAVFKRRRILVSRDITSRKIECVNFQL